MELNEMEKKLLFQVEGDYQTKILNELYMTVRYSNNSEQREAAEGLMAKLRVLSNAECMDLVKDIQKNYRLPYDNEQSPSAQYGVVLKGKGAFITYVVAAGRLGLYHERTRPYLQGRCGFYHYCPEGTGAAWLSHQAAPPL